jgi:hypothetical protein
MPQLHRYRLFISHAWRYHDDYARIVEMLDDAPRFIYSNYSVPRDDSYDGMGNDELYEQLRKQIRPVESVVILGGLYVSYSNWIRFEINFAKRLQKPIIGVKPWGSTRTPKAVKQSANVIVGWNTSTIVSAIREYS